MQVSPFQKFQKFMSSGTFNRINHPQASLLRAGLQVQRHNGVGSGGMRIHVGGTNYLSNRLWPGMKLPGIWKINSLSNWAKLAKISGSGCQATTDYPTSDSSDSSDCHSNRSIPPSCADFMSEVHKSKHFFLRERGSLEKPLFSVAKTINGYINGGIYKP